MRSTHVVRIIGKTTFEDGSQAPFLMLKKAPRYVLLKVPTVAGSYVQWHDGAKTWKRLPGQALDEAEAMAPEEAMSFARDAVIFDALMYWGERGYAYELLEPVRVLRKKLHQIRATVPGGEQITYQLDPDTFDILRQEAREFYKGQWVTMQVRFQRYRRTEAGPFAYRSESYVDGKLVNVTEIEEVTVNPGVLRFVFAPPPKKGEILGPLSAQPLILDTPLSEQLPGVVESFGFMSGTGQSFLPGSTVSHYARQIQRADLEEAEAQLGLEPEQPAPGAPASK